LNRELLVQLANTWPHISLPLPPLPTLADWSTESLIQDIFHSPASASSIPVLSPQFPISTQQTQHSII